MYLDKKGKAISDHDRFNQYFFLPGHFVEIRYTPLNTHEPNMAAQGNIFRRFLSMLGIDSLEEGYSYWSIVEHMPSMNDVNPWYRTVIYIQPQSNIETITHSVEVIAIYDALAKVGGIFGLVAALIIFLFGTNRLSPWGITAELPPIKRRIKMSLPKVYDNERGKSKGPFTQCLVNTGKIDSNIQTTENKISFLKEQIVELEAVLRDY